MIGSAVVLCFQLFVWKLNFHLPVFEAQSLDRFHRNSTPQAPWSQLSMMDTPQTHSILHQSLSPHSSDLRPNLGPEMPSPSTGLGASLKLEQATQVENHHIRLLNKSI
ncbi:hypothetical protein BJY00DRAFT_184345 [Aspergillus carlsbadensis]|nr:hypothetical protein BJY00DRAFT_184345 [Aspergillus carlsbadensis]